MSKAREGTGGARRDRGHANTALVIALLCTVLLIAVEGLVRRRHDRAVRPETSSCAIVRGDFWNPLSGVEYTGRLAVALPARAGGAIVLFVGDALRVKLEAETVDRTLVPLVIDRLRAGPGVNVPPDFWLESGSPWSTAGEVVRARLDALPRGDRLVYVHLGRRAPRVLARLMGYDADARASVCAARLDARDAFAGSDEFELTPPQSEYFARGWHAEDHTSGTPLRWMKDSGAILLPSARDGSLQVALEAAPASSIAAHDVVTLSLRVNDVFEASPIPMRDGFSQYIWEIPGAAWVNGTNELLFTVSPTTMRGGEVYSLALKRLELRLR